MPAAARKMKPSPSVSMTTANCGWPMTRRKTTVEYEAEGGDGNREECADPVVEAEMGDQANATKPPSIMMSPWAKLIISVAL